MKKRIFSLMLCIILMIPLCSFAETEDLIFEMAEYNDTIVFLTAFDIVERDDAVLTTDDWTISRGEFAYLVVKCLGEESIIGFINDENSFLDVGEDYPYAKHIAFLKSRGMLSGETGRFFRPNEPVTRDFASMLGVYMTGRDVYLSKEKDYAKVAYSAKLFTNVETYGDGCLSRGGALSFLKNTLTVELVVYDAIDSSGSKENIHVAEDANLLSTALKFKRRRGVVMSDGITTIMGNRCDAGSICIDNEIYLSVCNTTEGLAGKRVEYYVSEYEGKDAVFYIEEYNNEVLTIQSSSINGYDPVTGCYSALISGKETRLDVKGAMVSYNNEPDYDPSRMVPTSGYITLIENSGDSQYDAVLILNFTNTIVDYYSSYTETIYDIDSRVVEGVSIDNIDLFGAKNIYITDNNNVSVLPDELLKYNIVSKFESYDGKTVQLRVSSEKKTGVLTEIDAENRQVVLDGKYYGISLDARFNFDELQLAKTYECYFDANGDIAYLIPDSGVMSYLINAGKGKGLSDKIEIQVLDEQSGVVSIYNLAKKVTYTTPTTTVKKKRTEIYEEKLFDATSGKFVRKAVLLGFNADNEVNSIIEPLEISTYNQVFTAMDYPLYELAYLRNDRPEISGGPVTSSSGSMQYRNNGGALNRWLIMDSGTRKFYVPAPEEENVDSDMFSIQNVKMSDGDTQRSNMLYYSKDLKSISVPYVVDYARASADLTVKSTWPFVVTNIVGCSHEQLGDTYRLTLYGSTGETVLYTSDKNVINRSNWIVDDSNQNGTDLQKVREDKTVIEKGDIILFSKNAMGHIDNVLLLWDARSNINNLNNERFGNETMVAAPTSLSSPGPVGAIIKRKSGNNIEFEIDIKDSKNNYQIQRMVWGLNVRTALIQFNGRKVEFSEGISASELVPGDRIVLPNATNTGKVYNMIVYRR